MTISVRRGAGAIGVAVITLGICYGIAALSGWEPSWGYLARAIIHTGELAVVVALTGTAAAIGAERLGRFGLGVAMLGQVLLVVAELVFPMRPDLGNVLFAIGPLATGAGMVAAGVAVLRARTWRGWQRMLPLLVGIWILVPTTPVMMITGGPPAPLALGAIIVWDVLWALTGVAMLTATASARHPSAVVD
jgi:hypothetical protein